MSHSKNDINTNIIAHIERFHPTYTSKEKKEVYHVLKKLANDQKKREEEDPLFGEEAYRTHVRQTQHNYNKKKYPQYHRMNNNYFRAVTSSASKKENRRVSATQKQKLARNKKHVEEQEFQKILQKERNERNKSLREKANREKDIPGKPKMFGMMYATPSFSPSVSLNSRGNPRPRRKSPRKSLSK